MVSNPAALKRATSGGRAEGVRRAPRGGRQIVSGRLHGTIKQPLGSRHDRRSRDDAGQERRGVCGSVDRGALRHRFAVAIRESRYELKKCLDRLVEIRDDPKSSTDDVVKACPRDRAHVRHRQGKATALAGVPRSAVVHATPAEQATKMAEHAAREAPHVARTVSAPRRQGKVVLGAPLWGRSGWSCGSDATGKGPS